MSTRPVFCTRWAVVDDEGEVVSRTYKRKATAEMARLTKLEILPSCTFRVARVEIREVGREGRDGSGGAT